MNHQTIPKTHVLNLNDKYRQEFLDAIHSNERIQGLTHSFYRYPARFSPRFAAAAINCFSKHGDLILDPYMGGGTTVVEALAAGRRIVGNDLNALGVFLAKVKTLRLTKTEKLEFQTWLATVPETISFVRPLPASHSLFIEQRTKNLHLHRSRFIKKGIAQTLLTIDKLSSENAKIFARCVLLDVAQWALDGKRTHTTMTQFRQKVQTRAEKMLVELECFSEVASPFMDTDNEICCIAEGDALNIGSLPIFAKKGEKASLVVTSPPYPGVHVLYHRWQVDGRKETPAPYWITSCNDGKGAAYYNFGCRQQKGLCGYFETASRTFKAVREVMRKDGLLVQLIAFSNPKRDLPKYLKVLESVGFKENFLLPPSRNGACCRVWRAVPNRKWHAISKGKTRSSREVVLIHKAI